MTKKTLTYEKAGVSTTRAQTLLKGIHAMGKGLRDIPRSDSKGGFAAILDLPKGFKNPQIVLSTDGVGTKVLLCQKMKTYHTIGIDLVAMCANDVLAVGAQPYAFLDYYATSKLDPKVSRSVLKGIIKGCKLANMALVGGETAEMPGIYKDQDFDLAGFCVGWIEKKNIQNPKHLNPGDVLVGLPSSGIHANGFSLVRHILKKQKINYTDAYQGTSKSWGEVLLKPTKIYVSDVLTWVQKGKIKSMVHVTGGGFEENILRVLPQGLKAIVDTKTWKVPKLFKALQALGHIEASEMYHTFNMGIGFIMIVQKSELGGILKGIPGSKQIGILEKAFKRKKSVELV